MMMMTLRSPSQRDSKGMSSAVLLKKSLRCCAFSRNTGACHEEPEKTISTGRELSGKSREITPMRSRIDVPLI